MAEYFGGLPARGERQISTGQDGLVTLREVTYDDGTAYTVRPDIGFGEAHSDFSYLKCTGGTQTEEGKGIWKITKTFQGINTTCETWRVNAAVSQEPIESHEDFVDLIGGTGDLPLNGAVFEDDTEEAKFKYFPASAAWDLGGVKSYLEPTCQLEHTIVKKHNGSNSAPAWDSISDVGQITTSLPSAPAVASGRNWLLMGTTQEVIGGALRVRKTFRLSGRLGWNGIIYDNSAPDPNA